MDNHKRKLFYVLILIIPAVLIALISFGVSSYPMDYSDVVAIIQMHIDHRAPTTYREEILDMLIYDEYIPRAIVGVLVGVILATGGAVMQSAIKNPLADSYTTGISSGALLGVTIAVVYGVSLFPGNEHLGQITNAFIFALIPTAIILLFTAKRPCTPTMMILIGIGVMYIFSATTTVIKYSADPVHIAQIYEWSVGTLTGTSWDAVPFLIISAVVLVTTMFLLSGKLNVISAGDKAAIALGVNPHATRAIVLVIVAVCTVIAVCFTGSIGFVGLVIPHLARMLVGSNLKILIPCSATIGGLLVIGADCIARIAGPNGLPVGVITTIIGSPLLVYFLVKKKSSW